MIEQCPNAVDLKHHMLKICQYESLNPSVNRFLWMADRIGAMFCRPPPSSQKSCTYEGIKRLLLVRCDGIGDLMCSIPAIQAICKTYSSARVDLMVGPWNRDLAEMISGPASVVVHAPWGFRVLRADRRGIGLGEDLRIRRLIRSASYDLAVDLRGDLLSLLPMATWNIPHRVGRLARGGGFTLTRSIGGEDRIAHEIDRTNRVAEAIGAIVEARQPHLLVSGEAIEKARNILHEQDLSPDRLIILCPFAQWKWKHWPDEHYYELVPWLTRQGYDVILVGGKIDAERAAILNKVLGERVKNLTGRLDLKTLAGLFALCRAFVAVDSGPAHLAAATGCDGVVLFGSSDPKRFGPVSNHVRLLQDNQCPLYPCYQGGDCLNQSNWCMKAISVNDVRRALEPMLWPQVNQA